ncbi:MAG: hypothetical protein JWN93_522 [Hyphomicrobiales bacterium]|nr:hypothetical protein [Hyphomicrobiales bacterium]
MKAFAAAVVFAIVAAVVAQFALNTQQRAAWTAFSTDSVRVGDPGHNLVGGG